MASNIGFWIVSAVLIGSGATKVTQPEPFARFIADSTGGTFNVGLVRGVAALEMILGLAGLTFGGRVTAGLICAAYLFFTVVVATAMRSGAETCGCFGAASTKPKPAHLWMNVVSAVVASVGLAVDAPGLADGLSGQGVMAVVILIAVVLGTAAVFFVDTR